MAGLADASGYVHLYQLKEAGDIYVSEKTCSVGIGEDTLGLSLDWSTAKFER